MKKLIIISIFSLFSLSICQEYNYYNQYNIREEIISRYENGNKKIVVKYSGQGSNEKIVERITYSENDEIVLIEKPLEKRKISFLYHENGNLKSKESHNKNGKEDGESSWYYENGQIEKKGEYNDGLMDGQWIYYYNNGQMKGKGYFIKGNGTKLGSLGIPRHGRDKLWTFWYENGQEQDKVTYVEGIKNGLTINWYETGQKRVEGQWEDGQLHGKWVWYYENGKIDREIAYKDKIGKLIEYYENGNISVQGSFIKGIVDKYSFQSKGSRSIGEWIYYNEDGTILEIKVLECSLKGYWKRIQWTFVEDENIENYMDDDSKRNVYTIFNDTSNVFYSFVKGEDYTLENHLISYIDYPSSCDDTQLNIKKSGGKVLLGFDWDPGIKEIVEREGEWRVNYLSKDTIRLFFSKEEPQKPYMYETYIRFDSNKLPPYLKEILD